MVSNLRKPINWKGQRPEAFDIVACYYPETKPKGELRLRPCLILDVFEDEETGEYFCLVTNGTRTLKISQRLKLDIIIQKSAHLDEMGLPYATRFALDDDNIVMLPWNEEFFGCWRGYRTPQISYLMETYQRQYAYIMALRQVARREG
ncbi:hypothetical protein J2T09_005565 [Neorhizobium huautlense]|uniref:Uncharacterized protein n=1 Tax=Neorhizobium huautlense TaxID=67774 RepID=A0ABT9Q218_9HYPH|nr:hypothetical protein [Neorhizobium huautlense]MDP9840777.1 hypothetical protein [Neorhizobium huautlense]